MKGVGVTGSPLGCVGQVDDGTAQEAAVESTHNSGPGDLGVGSLVDSQYVKYTERETWMQTLREIREVCKYAKLAKREA